MFLIIFNELLLSVFLFDFVFIVNGYRLNVLVRNFMIMIIFYLVLLWRILFRGILRMIRVLVCEMNVGNRILLGIINVR